MLIGLIVPCPAAMWENDRALWREADAAYKYCLAQMESHEKTLEFYSDAVSTHLEPLNRWILDLVLGWKNVREQRGGKGEGRGEGEEEGKGSE